MVITEFDYVKKSNQEKTHRKVFILKDKDTYFDAIDYGHLSPLEIARVEEIQQKYEHDMKPFIEKAFRRFSKEGIDNLTEEKRNE